nr:non-canonical purine NTP pyrophosphatase [Edaphobacter aggregans]
MNLYVATTNQGKLRDFAAAAGANSGITIEPLPGLAAMPAPAEDEPTFASNARLKALAYSRLAPGLLVVADDSGLEVDALSGAPGVRSARYADDSGFATDTDLPVDEKNNLCLLAALEAIPKTSPDAGRQARYHCVLATARDGVVVATGDGTVEGTILHKPQGTGGFGYDPLFYLPEFGQTMAELDLETKLTLSHRGRAFRALIKALG